MRGRDAVLSAVGIVVAFAVVAFVWASPMFIGVWGVGLWAVSAFVLLVLVLMIPANDRQRTPLPSQGNQEP